MTATAPEEVWMREEREREEKKKKKEKQSEVDASLEGPQPLIGLLLDGCLAHLSLIEMARASLLTKLECAASPLRTFNEKRFIVEKLTGETSRKKVRWREREINRERETEGRVGAHCCRVEPPSDRAEQ